MHDPEDRSEELLGVEAGAGLHADPHARAPQPSAAVVGGVEGGFDEPPLVALQLGEGPGELPFGLLDDRAHLGERIRGPPDTQRADSVGELTGETLRAPHRPDEDRQRRRGALLPRMPERALHEVGHGEVEGGRGRDDHGVLAAGLGEQGQVGTPGAEQRRGLPRPGEDHPVHRLVRDEGTAEVAFLDVDESESLTGHATVPQRLHEHRRTPPRLRGGLQDHAGARGERRQHATRGDREGEVPRRRDDGHAGGDEHGAGDRVELTAGRGVVPGEVDGLAHLDIGFGEDLARLHRRDLDQLRTPGLERRRCAQQHLGPFGCRTRTPGRRRTLHTAHDAAEVVGVVDAGRVQDLRPDRRVREPCADPRRPLAVGGEREIRIGRVREARGAPGVLPTLARRVHGGLEVGAGVGVVRAAHDAEHGLGEIGLRDRADRRRPHGLVHRREAVLRAPRAEAEGRVPRPVERVEEAAGLAGEERLVVVQVERRGEEVLGRRVLLQPPHEVADGHVELGGRHDRHVQQHRTDFAGHRLHLPLSHAEQHLELDRVADAPLPGPQPRVGDAEEVVAGHADPHGRRVLGPQRPVEAAQVVGVGVELGVVGRGRPPVQRRLDVLHREVRALHEAHLDAGSPVDHAVLRPGGELLEGRERVGEVGLQHDPGLETGEPRILQDPREDGDREVEVAILLHVEVDEGAVCRRRHVQREQPLHDPVDDLVEAPHRDAADDGGDLDRHVVDVRTPDELMDAVEPPLRLRLAQHGLTEEVEVQTRPRLPQLLDGGSELRGPRVHHEVPHHLAQGPPREGDDRCRQHRGDTAAEPHGGAQVPRQELRHDGRDPAQLGGRGGQALRPHHAVDETEGERQTVGVAQDSGEAFRCGVDVGRGRLDHPAAREFDGLIGEGCGCPRLRGG